MDNIVYIAGKIHGDENYKEKFSRAEEILSKRGFIVINPAKIPEGLHPDSYMPICLALINAADIICLIGKDWQESNGAKIEADLAYYQGKKVITLQGEDEDAGL
jgi:nucleoside 2-deoxyribosyltransferase